MSMGGQDMSISSQYGGCFKRRKLTIWNHIDLTRTGPKLLKYEVWFVFFFLISYEKKLLVQSQGLISSVTQ